MIKPTDGRDRLTWLTDGAQLLASALNAQFLRELEQALTGSPRRPGVRLRSSPALSALLDPDGPIGSIASGVLGGAARPVRAVLFDKTAATNSSLAWHQDRTIVVAARIDVAGFGPWSLKDGLVHVAPPMTVLETMATLRIHLDPVPANDAPLLVAPGSHRLGRVDERDIPAVVERHGVAACLAEAGDVWLYATPILHASEAAARPTRRRVLQVDFSASDLPGGLQWLGV